MILSYRTGIYGHLDTLNSKIHPLFQILDIDPGWCNNSGTEEERRSIVVLDDRMSPVHTVMGVLIFRFHILICILYVMRDIYTG